MPMNAHHIMMMARRNNNPTMHTTATTTTTTTARNSSWIVLFFVLLMRMLISLIICSCSYEKAAAEAFVPIVISSTTRTRTRTRSRTTPSSKDELLVFASSPSSKDVEDVVPTSTTTSSTSTRTYNNNSNNNRRYKTIEIEEYEGYARCLSPRKEQEQVEAEFINDHDNDGRNNKRRRRPWWKRAFQRLRSFTVNNIIIKRRARGRKPGTLILLRCGQSELNQNSTFTGWLDPTLTSFGVEQCRHAGALLVAEGLDPDVVYTSRLQRSIISAWNVLEVLNALYIPIQKTFRLNQRMYGALQGLSKQQVTNEFGPEVVQAWRNSLKARPPPLSRDDPSHPIHDPRYADLVLDSSSSSSDGDDDDNADIIPDTESLLECQERAQKLWEYKISRDIQQGKTVLVVAHRDSLRGLIKVIDDIDDQHIESIAIPAGVPMVYKFDNYNKDNKDKDKNRMRPIEPDNGSLTQVYTRGAFLEKPGRLQQALERNQQYEQAFSSRTNDYDATTTKRTNTLERSLLKLRKVEEEAPTTTSTAAAAAASPPTSFADDEDVVRLKEVSSSINGTATTTLPSTASSSSSSSSRILPVEHWSDDECEFEEYDEFADVTANDNDFVLLPVVPIPLAAVGDDEDDSPVPKKTRTGPFVVLIRHGRTPHNNMQLFTGWEDPPLAPEGVEDAKNAGRLLKRHGFEFDVVYTSWLTRAIQTAYYCLLEMDMVWLPIIKSWRLNERMYGALTGKSKKMIANEYGEEQLKKWRRGYTIRPPPTSSYSLSYPGNDERRAKHFKDLPISFRETINRSIEGRRLSIHRKFPKTESLKDCMDRSIPFYTQRIQKEAIDKGKRVLITSHENAIRGILMHLCDIPPDAMNQLHLPNGLPLVYDVKRRCISLLLDDDDHHHKKDNVVDAHDFGPAAKYLFRECLLLDDDEEDEEEENLEN